MKLLATFILLISFNSFSQLNATVSGTASVCVGTSSNITFTGLNGTPPYTFTYNINGGSNQMITTSGGNDYVLNPGTGTSGVFTYNLVSVQDATMASQNVNETATLTVNSIPMVSGGSDIALCHGQTITLNGSGASTYTWNNGVINGVAFTPAIGSIIYTVTGTTSQGCVNSDQVLITANPPPIVNAGPDVTICSGNSTTITATGAAIYSWLPSSDLSSTTGATVNASPSSTVAYIVTGTSVMGCTATDHVVITVLPNIVNPGATIDSAYCNNGAISIIQGPNTTNFTYNWMTGSTTSFINNLAAGSYTVAITDFTTGCTLPFTYVVPNSIIPGNCAELSGSVYFDNNENCSINTGDDPVANRMIVANPGNYLTVTDANGFYSLQLPVGTYTVQEIFANPSSGNFCNMSYTVPLLNISDSVGSNNFLDTITGDIDLQAYIYSTAIMPGFSFYVTPLFYNLTSEGTLLNTEAWVKLPPGVTMLNWTYPHTVSNDTIYFTINTPDSFTSQIWFIASGVTLGSPVTFCVGVETQTGELITANNTYCKTYTVIGSYDPNDKTTFLNGVQSDSTIFETDETLDYVIRFQNTGTAPAQNIYVLDTIQSTLNLSTFELISTSHDCNVSILEGNVLKFNFPMIMLPDSTNNEPESHGFVHYRIKQNSSNTLGTVIKNTAHIYFDFNAAVITNTTQDTIIAEPISAGLSIDVSGCLGANPLPITFTGTNGTPPYTFTYNINGGTNQTISTTSGSSVTLNVLTSAAGTFNYQLTYVTDGIGSSQTLSDNTIATIYDLPIVNAGPDQSICQGSSVVLSGSGASSYEWDNSVINGVSFNPSSTNTYLVTGTDANGCVNTDQVNVTVNLLPIVNAGPDQTICPGFSVTLTGTGASTYSWNNSVTNGVVFTPVSTNTYTVIGTSSDGCIGTDQVTIFVDCSGLEENNFINIKLYPNPTSGAVTIHSDFQIEEVKILNANGQLLNSIKINSNSSEINLDGYHQGIYFVEIYAEFGKTTKRLIIQ